MVWTPLDWIFFFTAGSQSASSSICLDHIVQKIFLYLSLKDDEGEPLYLYDTAVDLAEHELEEDIESSVVNGFQEFFSIGI